LCISAPLFISKLQRSRLPLIQTRFLKKKFHIYKQAVGKFGKQWNSSNYITYSPWKYINISLGHLTVYHQFYVNQISLLINLNVISLITIRKWLKKFMTLVCRGLSKQSVLNVFHVVPYMFSLSVTIVSIEVFLKYWFNTLPRADQFIWSSSSRYSYTF
jgi:hypothetical protein